MSLREDFPWLGDSAYLWEPAVTMGTAALSEIPAGYYGLLEWARTGDPIAGANAVRDYQDRATYMPRTEQGMEGMMDLAGGVDAAMNYGGLLDAPSLNDIIPVAQEAAGRLGAGPAALAEGLLQAGLPGPARKADLPMDAANRMRRAADLGFDTNNRLYHGSAAEGVPVDLTDFQVGGVPVYKRGEPVDYSPYQFTQQPTTRDHVRAGLQEDFLIEQGRLEDAAYAGGDAGLLSEARKMIDERIDDYKDSWPEAVPELKRIKQRMDQGANVTRYEGGPSPQGIEAFDPAAFNDGLYGRGVYMTDNPVVAGGGEGNTVAELGYANNPGFAKLRATELSLESDIADARRKLQDPDLSPEMRANIEGRLVEHQQEMRELRGTVTGAPTVYPLYSAVQNPWNADTGKVKRKDLPPERRAELEDRMLGQGKNPKGKWPMSDEYMRYIMGNDWMNETLQAMGYDGIVHKGGGIVGDVPHNVTIAFDPSDVRSVNAAFDPAQRTSPGLLAGGAAAAVGLGALSEPEDELERF